MSRQIDERVVGMEFDNRNFETNANQTIGTVDKLKQALNFKDAGKGLNEVDKAAKNVDLSPLAKGAEAVQLKFTALQVAAATVFANITNMAFNAGKNLASAFTTDAIVDGFHEYELQIKSVQTILANTKSKGTTLDDVNAALDELNHYADMTIYNFGEMTKNIGTFTAAGVDLDKAVAAIKGIANLGAMSGSTSMQVNAAMYQLSQALAAGKVSLMDWNSVVNAGMGGEQFQNALIRTSEVLGTGAEAAIEKYGTFRESLTEGQWLTTEVLTETLKQISGAYSEADLMAQGYTESQAKAIVEMAQTATEAATQVKTFSDLISTTKEALGSGWAQTFEILIGDYGEAAELFTNLSEAISEPINKSAEARNAMLEVWSKQGGRQDLLDGLTNAFSSLASILDRVKTAFTEVFPPIGADNLLSITANFDRLTQYLKPSADTLDRIQRIAKGVFSIFSLLGKAVNAVGSAFLDFLGSEGVGSLFDTLLEGVAKIADVFTNLNSGDFSKGFFTGLSDGLTKALGTIGDLLKGITDAVGGLGGVLDGVFTTVGSVLGGIIDTIGAGLGWIADHISIGDIFAGLAGGGIFLLAKKISGVIGQISDAFSKLFGGGEDGEGGGGIKDKFTELLDGVHDSLAGFTNGINAASLLAIAAAIAVLTGALGDLSELSLPDIAVGIGAIGAMLIALNLSFRSIVKSLAKFDAKGIVKAGIALIAMAKAIDIMADALNKVADLSLEEIGRGLTALGGGLAELIGGLALMSKANVKVKDAVAIIALAEGCKILADALAKFADFNWDEIGRGLAAMGGALAEVTAALSVISKVGGGGALLGSLGIFVVAQSLAPIADALERLSELSWEEIGKGLLGMGGALAELAAVSGILGKVAGAKGLLGAATVLIAAQALEPIGKALEQIGDMSWEEIGKGLVGMGGALLELAGFSGAVGMISGLSGILGAGTILIAAQALKPIADALSQIGDMSWEEIGKGLVGMGGALLELTAGSALAGLTGLAGLVGAGTINLAAQALDDIANALKQFGTMSWEEIEKGLASMGAALGEIALGSIANTLGIIGGFNISNVAEPLGVLADSVKKWVDVEVPEGLGAQLTELARGVSAFTFSGFGAGALSTAAEPLGVMAESVKKWVGISVPEGIVDQFRVLADAIDKFTFSGFGAGGLSSVAGPLGTLADSVAKWTNVTVPETLGADLESLAKGVKAFDFSFGFSLDSFVGPLGTLADSVAKWANVTVPETLGADLESLAKGVKAFDFSFGFSLDSFVGPFGNLSDAVKKWDGITIPADIQTSLESLAKGVKAFDWSWGWSLDSYIEPLDKLAGVIPKYSGLAIATDIGTSIKSLGEGVRSLGGESPDDISNITDAIDSLGDAVTAVADTDFAGATAAITGFVDSLNNINISADAFSGLGQKITNDLVAGINSGKVFVQLAIVGLIAAINTQLQSSATSFGAAGITIGLALANAISTGLTTAVGAIQAGFAVAISSAISVAQGQAMMFSTVGVAMGMAMSSGISSTSGMVAASATVVAANSLQAINAQTPAFNASGMRLGRAVSEGVSAQRGIVKNAARNLVSGCEAILRSVRGSFYSAGSYVAQGFASGIRSGAYAAQVAARAMANAAKEAAEQALDVQSPSKVFMEIGEYVSLGMAKGIDNMADAAAKSSEAMANSSIGSAKMAIGAIADAMNNDIDFEPRIAPVVDLNNVESSAIKANSMLGNIVSDATLKSVRIVGGITDTRNQNGSIERLESKFSELDTRFSELNESMSTLANRPPDELSMYVDGKKLASSIAKPMNRQLGTISRRGALAR